MPTPLPEITKPTATYNLRYILRPSTLPTLGYILHTNINSDPQALISGCGPGWEPDQMSPLIHFLWHFQNHSDAMWTKRANKDCIPMVILPTHYQVGHFHSSGKRWIGRLQNIYCSDLILPMNNFVNHFTSIPVFSAGNGLPGMVWINYQFQPK